MIVDISSEPDQNHFVTEIICQTIGTSPAAAAAVNIVTESFLSVSCLQYEEVSQGQPQGDSDPNIEHHKYKGPPPVTSS